MHFDAFAYLRDRGIRVWTEGKNVRGNGWINICCPLCQDHSNHGQFAPPGWDGPPYTCWICKGHSLQAVIMALERIDYLEACRRVRQYQTVGTSVMVRRPRPRPSGRLSLPKGAGPMGRTHREYLRGRGFDPEDLEARYGLLGTGPVGDLPHRLVIPIIFRTQMVSWQSRDITGRAELRYISASPALEVVKHKEVVYNIDNCRGQAIIVVEGLTDVWRLGDNTGATFGTGFTRAQINLLACYRRVFTVYDSETQAQNDAQGLCRILSGMGVETVNILLDSGDPGDMSQDDADRLKRDLLGEQSYDQKEKGTTR